MISKKELEEHLKTRKGFILQWEGQLIDSHLSLYQKIHGLIKGLEEMKKWLKERLNGLPECKERIEFGARLYEIESFLTDLRTLAGKEESAEEKGAAYRNSILPVFPPATVEQRRRPMDKKMYCDIGFCRRQAVGYIESKWASTRRYYVCERHKEKEFKQNEIDMFRNPSFTPNLKFIELEKEGKNE